LEEEQLLVDIAAMGVSEKSSAENEEVVTHDSREVLSEPENIPYVVGD
jgi:hypothetical protein